jgi:pimeloyl-ACP methyl ester carboxylesterase
VIAHVNGIDMQWESTGDGEPLVWLHGFMGTGADWQHVFPDALPGHRLIAPDLPGHGASSGRPGPYSFRQSADDVYELLDSIGVDRVGIIGLSGGGITALHMATRQPERVTRLVAISAPASFPPQAREIQRNFSEGMLGAAEMARMRGRHSREGQIEALMAQTRAFADAADPAFTDADLASVTAPTLIVFGDRDFLYPVSMACELRRTIPRSWLWVVPNGGHGPIFGAHAAPFRRIAAEFLTGAWD